MFGKKRLFLLFKLCTGCRTVSKAKVGFSPGGLFSGQKTDGRKFNVRRSSVLYLNDSGRQVKYAKRNIPPFSNLLSQMEQSASPDAVTPRTASDRHLHRSVQKVVFFAQSQKSFLPFIIEGSMLVTENERD